MIARMSVAVQGFLWQHPLIRANLVYLLGAAALFLAEILLGLFISRGSQIIALALLALPGLYLLIVYQRFGVVLIMAVALFVRFKIGTGTESSIVMSMAVTALFVALWLLPQLLVQKQLSLRPTPANKPLLLFMAATVLALVWSNIFRDPLVYAWGSFPIVQAASTIVILLLGSAFLLVVNVVDDLRTWKAMVLLFLLSSILGYLELGFVQTRGVYAMWVMAFAYSQALFNRRLPWWLRIACLGLTAMWIEWSLLRRLTWLASWVPSMMALLLITLLRSKKAFFILLILVALLILSQKHVIDAAFAVESEVSGSTRMDAWLVNWRVTGQHLLLGTGPAGYAAYYMTYWPNDGVATHSNYIDIVAETGLIGLAFFLWFFGTILWSGYNFYRRFRQRWDFVSAYTTAAFVGCIGAIVIMGLGDWVTPFAYTQGIEGYDYALYSWMFLGGLYAVERLASSKQEKED